MRTVNWGFTAVAVAAAKVPELASEHIKGSGHRNNLLVVWGFCPPESLGFQPVKLALCRCHKGLVGDAGKFTIKVILLLTANVCFEVVAGTTSKL